MGPILLLPFARWDELNEQDECEGDEAHQWNRDESEIVDPADQTVVATKRISVRDTLKDDVIEGDGPSSPRHEADEQAIDGTVREHDREIINRERIHKYALEPT